MSEAHGGRRSSVAPAQGVGRAAAPTHLSAGPAFVVREGQRAGQAGCPQHVIRPSCLRQVLSVGPLPCLVSETVKPGRGQGAHEGGDLNPPF